MSGTVLSTRTGRHTPHSSGATRPAPAIRRTANAAPASVPPVALVPPTVASPFASPTVPAADQADGAESTPPADPFPIPAQRSGGSGISLLPTSLVEAADAAGAGPVASSPALTVTLAIPLTGEALTPQAYRLLDALRELVEMGQGTVVTDSAAPPQTRCDDVASSEDVFAAANMGRQAARAEVSLDWASPEMASSPATDPFEVRLLTASRQVTLGGEPLAMTRLEFDLLLFLAGNPRRVFTRAQLLGAVWGYEHTGERTVDVHVRRLRVKMGVHVPLITTVYGVGYRLDDDAQILVVDHH